MDFEIEIVLTIENRINEQYKEDKKIRRRSFNMSIIFYELREDFIKSPMINEMTNIDHILFSLIFILCST